MKSCYIMKDKIRPKTLKQQKLQVNQILMYTYKVHTCMHAHTYTHTNTEKHRQTDTHKQRGGVSLMHSLNLRQTSSYCTAWPRVLPAHSSSSAGSLQSQRGKCVLCFQISLISWDFRSWYCLHFEISFRVDLTRLMPYLQKLRSNIRMCSQDATL